jgi:protein-ribulosamine 3-kinase
VIVESADGSEKSYFLKCATDEMGKSMMEGEFAAMSEISKYMPSFAPKPYAWGKFSVSPPETYFLLMEYLDLGMDMVEPGEFCSRIAKLHQISTSPNGMFGFPIMTYHGPNPQNTEWESSWSVFFARLIGQFFDAEIQQNGPYLEYEDAFDILKTYVVPRLLEPLQSNGNILKPCLVHGDLWEGNVGTNLATGDPVIFDSGAMYAHNELELGMWRADIIRFGKVYFRQYLRHMPPSEPIEEWDDRNRLYSIKYLLSHCLGWPANAPHVREL